MMVPKSDPVRTAEALLEELCESPVVLSDDGLEVVIVAL
jgi:hypothetical protein